MSTEEIVELVRVFLPDGANEARIVDQVEASISKIADSGFLRPLKSQSANIVKLRGAPNFEGFRGRTMAFVAGSAAR